MPVDEAPKLCLVVDDSRMIRRVSRQIVESLGYLVTEAENGEEALAKCHTRLPDLVLLDWNMPVMSGLEFVAELRLLPGGSQPKVVFCTTERDEANIGKGIAAGADGYVIKPFDVEGLSDRLRRIGAA